MAAVLVCGLLKRWFKFIFGGKLGRFYYGSGVGNGVLFSAAVYFVVGWFICFIVILLYLMVLLLCLILYSLCFMVMLVRLLDINVNLFGMVIICCYWW